MERVQQIGWTLDYVDDLESDFSVFHRVDDIMSLPAPEFFRKAWRLGSYAGVMQARLVEQEPDPAPPHSPASQDIRSAPGRDINPGTRATLQADPAFTGIFSFESLG